MREHLLSVQRQTGNTPQALSGDIAMPDDAEYLWVWFCRLAGRRQAGMASNPLTWSDIDSFFYRIRTDPDEWEIQAIELLDNAWLSAQAKQQDKS